ncbi:MAG: hypothetical protein A2Z83_05040 [Omnitrophica bacterium GWA2_52_8]|nr:MAG: hypothetical protein A2Z83_05040 [Omnitrophica bacterium GWA2_52_8]
MVLKEINSIQSSTKDLRSFGFVVGGCFAGLAALSAWRGHGLAPMVLTAIGGPLIIGGWLYPRALKPLQKAWMTLAVLMGWVMTRVILSVIFFAVMMPFALCLKLMKKRFMMLEFDSRRASYWERKPEELFDAKKYEQQY